MQYRSEISFPHALARIPFSREEAQQVEHPSEVTITAVTLVTFGGAGVARHYTLSKDTEHTQQVNG